MSGVITPGMNYSQVKSILESGGQITIKKATYAFGGKNDVITIKPGSNIVAEDGALITNNNSNYQYNNNGKITINVSGSGTTISNLKVRGKFGYTIGGNGHNFIGCEVNCASENTAQPYQAADGLVAAFNMSSSTSNTTFTRCVAKYTYHHGWTMNANGKYENVTFNYCSAISCGSGLEAPPIRTKGNSRWATGFDTPDAAATVINLNFNNCYAYDSLQSGFHIDGTFDGHVQSINGVTYTNCIAENCGQRLLQAWLRNPNSGYQYGHINDKYPPWDFYASGFYITNSYNSRPIKLINCKTINCARAGIMIWNSTNVIFQNVEDVGSYISILTSGTNGIVYDNVISTRAKAYALSTHGSNHQLKLFKVIDFTGTNGHKPFLVNLAPGGSFRKIRPGQEVNLGANNSGVVCAIDGNSGNTTAGSSYTALLRSNPTSFSVANIKVNQSQYASASALMQPNNSKGSIPSASVSIFTPTDADHIYPEVNGGDVPSTPCGTIDCTAKQRWVCPDGKNGSWQAISETDPDYIQRCGSAECLGSEVKCVDGKEYQCNGGVWKATGKTCTDEALSPYGTKPVLNNSAVTKIYARDFAQGGSGKAYVDSTPGSQSSYTGYRNDAGDVDLVNWPQERTAEPESDRIVVAYTTSGEWLAYPVKVESSGTFKISLRVSTITDTSKINFFVADEKTGTINLPKTSEDFSTFQTVESQVVIPEIGETRVIKLEFDGDLNLSWFTLNWLNTNGSRVPNDEDPVEPKELTQVPYNDFVIRDEYNYSTIIEASWYDYGGEGKAYHNELVAEPETFNRDIDTLELVRDGVDVALAVSTGEWVEYTVNVADTADYYINLSTKNADSNSKIKIAIVDSFGQETNKILEVPVPVTPGGFTEFNANVDGNTKFKLMKGTVTLRFTFTGQFKFKRVKFTSKASFEGVVESRPFKTINLPVSLISPQIEIQCYEFDYGGPGISYSDTTSERYVYNSVRDTDVDIFTLSKNTSTFISNTTAGEWVQYTVINPTTAEYTTLYMDVECSTLLADSKIRIVIENENAANTFAEDGEYSNTYSFTPAQVRRYTEVQFTTLIIKVYKGLNKIKVFFDDNITFGKMIFRFKE